MKQLLFLCLMLIASACHAQRWVKSYPTIADALASPTLMDVYTNVLVLGYSSANDGGGGEFYVDKGSSTTADGGTVFAFTGGRLKRIIRNSTVNVRMFGAKGDSTTDDTASIQACLNWRDPVSGRPGNYEFPTGWYRVNSVYATGGYIFGAGHIDRGADVVPNSGVILEHVLGATGDMLVLGRDAGNNSLTLDNFLLLGHPEYNIRSPITITAVYPGDRLHFDVASPPVITGGKNGVPYLGFGAVFDDSNHFLGSFCLQSFITNGVTIATNTVNIVTGTDSYATVAGEDILRVGFKVCFPQSAEWFSYGVSMGQRAFSSRAGYSAIRVWDSDQCNLSNIKAVNWHTGVVIASPGYVASNIETYNCHLSGFIAEPMGFLADNTTFGFLLFNGRYQADDALSPSPYVLKNTLYRSSAIGFGAVGAQAKHGQIVAGPTAMYGAYLYGSVNSHFENLLIESPALYPIYAPQGNSATPQTATTIGRLRILGGYAADSIPDNRPSTIPIIEVGSSGAGVSVGQMTVGRFTESGNGPLWTWGYVYKWPSYATNTGLVAIGNFVDPNRMVAAQNPGGTSYQQAWNLMGGTTVTGGSATQPIMTWQRDVAEPNVNKVGITYSGGAKILFAHDGDGVLNDVGYSLESTTTATQLTAGNNSGAAAPRFGIIQGEPATGTDVSGGNLFIKPGPGRGNGPSAGIFFQTPVVGASGSTAQSQATRVSIGQGGHMVFTGLAADPTVGTQTGGFYYNNTSNVFKIHNGTAWKPVKTGVVIRIAANLNFPSTSAQTESDTTVSVPGAVLGDVVNLGVPNASIVAGSFFNAWVSATDTVTVRFNNYSSTSKDPALGTFTIDVEQ